MKTGKKIAIAGAIPALLGAGLIVGGIRTALSAPAVGTIWLTASDTVTAGITAHAPSSAIPMVIAGTTFLALGMILLVIGQKLSARIEGEDALKTLSAISAAIGVVALGYGVGHFCIAPMLASYTTGTALILEGVSSFALSIIAPIAIFGATWAFGIGVNQKDGDAASKYKSEAAATLPTAAICIGSASALSVIGAPILSTAIGATGGQAIAIELMATISIAAIASMAVSYFCAQEIGLIESGKNT